MNTFGCILSSVDLRDYRLKRGLVDKKDIPDSYNINMLHRIKNQEDVSSCTAHALSSILEYHDNNVVTLSTNFIYGIRRKLYGMTGKGEQLRVALNISKDYGDPRKNLCNGNTEVDAVFDIAERAYEDQAVVDDAYKHRIKSYVKLSNDDEVKYAIMNYGPVLASIEWYLDNNYNPETHFIDTEKVSSKSYHAIVIYGWDEDGWLCQNSWGISWGNNGLFRIKYDYGLKEIYSVIDDENLSSDTDEVIKPANNKIIEFILKLINKIINWVLGR